MELPETRYAKSGDLNIAGSGLRFEDRGLHELRGLPEQLHIYALAEQH
jgi:hypothetical protein